MCVVHSENHKTYSPIINMYTYIYNKIYRCGSQNNSFLCIAQNTSKIQIIKILYIFRFLKYSPKMPVYTLGKKRDLYL